MINYSIIIPHYNIPDLLARCLRSIPERDDVQVIVVDDNSPGHENYLGTIPELSRKNVEFYATVDGLGAGHARNIGLQHAKGKWLIFSDSDDFFVDDISEILDQYINDVHDIIYFNIKSCDSYDISRQIPSNKDRLFNEYESSGNELIFRVGYTEPWGKIIRHQLIVDNGISFQETLGHNDLLFSIMAGVKARTIDTINRPMYWYVIREGSLGHQKGMESINKIQDRIIAWKSTQDFLETEHIGLKLYLPAIPCIKVLRKSILMFPKLMRISTNVGCNNFYIMWSIIRYYFNKLFKKKYGIGIDYHLIKK